MNGIGTRACQGAQDNRRELLPAFEVAGVASQDDTDEDWLEFLALATPADNTEWNAGPGWQNRPVLLSF